MSNPGEYPFQNLANGLRSLSSLVLIVFILILEGLKITLDREAREVVGGGVATERERERERERVVPVAVPVVIVACLYSHHHHHHPDGCASGYRSYGEGEDSTSCGRRYLGTVLGRDAPTLASGLSRPCVPLGFLNFRTPKF